MNRVVKQTPVNDSEFRYEVRIEGESCPAKTQASRMAQLDLLRTLSSTPGLLDCGVQVFETLKMTHDGERWVVTLEAVGA